MSADPEYEFPTRPFSIEEAILLRKRVHAFAHTAPMVGLDSQETGQGTNAKAVVGMYIGIGHGGHYFGFNNRTDEWESVSTFSYDGRPKRSDLAESVTELVTWIKRMYPGEPLVLYDPKDRTLN